MRQVLLLCFLLPSLLYAQESIRVKQMISHTGIEWTSDLTWEQLFAKAKSEDKYIFIYCHATWCVPCKQMEKTVYINDSVGHYINDRFVSVKVQFDSTAKDNENIRKWHEEARKLNEQYNLKGFPCFLFFNNDGSLIHRELGYKDVVQFLEIAAAAIDPERKKIRSGIEEYKSGIKDYPKMPELAVAAEELLGDRSLSEMIVRDYKDNYLNRLSTDQLLLNKHILFAGMHRSLFDSDDLLFRIIYQQPAKVDSIVGINGFSSGLVEYLVTKEEIEDKLWQDNKAIVNEPDWNKILYDISNKYDSKLAETILPPAQLKFYYSNKNWKEYIRYVDHLLNKYPPQAGGRLFGNAAGIPDFGDAWALNSLAWGIFLQANDKKAIRKAIEWSDLSIELEKDSGVIFQFYDTKANLSYKMAILYKKGTIKKAITIEKKALELVNALQSDAKKMFQDEYGAIIKKMEKKIPTWPTTKDNNPD